MSFRRPTELVVASPEIEARLRAERIKSFFGNPMPAEEARAKFALLPDGATIYLPAMCKTCKTLIKIRAIVNMKLAKLPGQIVKLQTVDAEPRNCRCEKPQLIMDISRFRRVE